MIDSLTHDSVNTACQFLKHKPKLENSSYIWIWISCIEFVIIVFLILRGFFNKRTNPKRKFKEDTLNQSIDFNNIINSSFNSRKLYDELKVKCHPDRFPSDPNKIAIATQLSQEISKNRTNSIKLFELKKEAIQKLNINP